MSAKCRRRFTGTGQTNDQTDFATFFHVKDLAAGVKCQATAFEDQLVPHPQSALFTLTEVIAVEDACYFVLEVDRDETIIGKAFSLEIRRIDDIELGAEVCVLLRGRSEVELLLHCRDIRIGLLDGKPGCGTSGRISTNKAIDYDHVLGLDVLVLKRCHFLCALEGDGLVTVRIGVVGDHEGRGLRACGNFNVDVVVPKFGLLCVWHRCNELTKSLSAWIPEYRLGLNEKVLRCSAGHS